MRQGPADEAVVAEALRRAVRTTSAYGSVLYLPSADRRGLVLSAVAGVPVELLSGFRHLSVAAPLPASEAFRTGRTVLLADPEETMRRYPRLALGLPHLHALACTPVSVPVSAQASTGPDGPAPADGHPLGVLAVVWPAGYHPPPSARRQLRTTANRLATALAAHPPEPPEDPLTVTPEEPSHPAAAAVERLRDGVVALGTDARVTYLNRSAELLLRTDREELIGRQPWSVLTWLAEPAYEDRYRAAMLAQQPTAFLACRPPGHWLAFSLYPDPDGLTVRIVPAGPPAGPGAALPEAPPAAPATLGATYHLLQLASALTEAVTVREVCDCVIEQILPGFGGQELAIYLARAGRMHLIAQSGYPDGFLDAFEGVPVRSRLPGTEVFSSGTPVFFESAGELQAAYPGIAQDEMGAWAFLPLIASGSPVGSCILGFPRSRAFGAEERAVLTALGGLIAQALDRARLYDAEFALARGLQQALLPHRLPEVPGLAVVARYLPGTRGMEIGGDWYDVIAGGDGGVSLVIGDVEGHSVGAAATMGQLRSAVRAFVGSAGSPDEVLSRTNRLLLELDPGLLASCLLLRLDPATGRARAVRAGHVPPLLRCPDGRTELLELAGGPLLGVDPGAEYPCTELELPPGAVLAMYTDGLVERPGASLDEGLDRLRSDLAHRPAADLDRLADRLLGEARHSAHRADDVALLLASRS
ncbi:SpoIIE family protein phosphatase [Kitasatospora sp. NPDC096147]|uniref:SpoIIE family protein phosphatase n=1 Tax=Kitasatospora sp. NPDC096147 TaxID=3364093 RepID=UPI003821A0CA